MTRSPRPTPPPARGHVTWTLNRSATPSPDELDAYARITAAMDAAVARWNRLSDVTRHITVNYNPGVPTAQGSSNGTIDFGANRGFMQEGTALHETAHVMGVGQSGGWWANGGGSGNWTGAKALAVVRSFDGPGAGLSTGGGHFWPYGLNYPNEFSDQAFDRNVLIVTAMMADGL